MLHVCTQKREVEVVTSIEHNINKPPNHPVIVFFTLNTSHSCAVSSEFEQYRDNSLIHKKKNKYNVGAKLKK
jgi:hypothetical protein